MGTALSAPVVMLGAQAWAIVALVRRPDAAAERTLGGLGAAMTEGDSLSQAVTPLIGSAHPIRGC